MNHKTVAMCVTMLIGLLSALNAPPGRAAEEAARPRADRPRYQPLNRMATAPSLSQLPIKPVPSGSLRRSDPNAPLGGAADFEKALGTTHPQTTRKAAGAKGRNTDPFLQEYAAYKKFQAGATKARSMSTSALRAKLRELDAELDTIETELRRRKAPMECQHLLRWRSGDERGQSEVSLLIEAAAGAAMSRIATTEMAARLPRLTAQQVYQRAVATVVTVEASGNEPSSGTGFFWSASEVVTNYHVIAGCDKITAHTATGRELVVTGVEWADQEQDLAVLALGGVDAPSKTTGHPSLLPASTVHAPTVGARVFVIGNPRGLENTLSDGLIAGFRSQNAFSRLIQITAPISPGSSGSPVLNEYGEVIGVASSQVADSQNLNFCIPADRIPSAMGEDWTPPMRRHAAAMSLTDWRSYSSAHIGLRIPASDRALRDRLSANHTDPAQAQEIWGLRSIPALLLVAGVENPRLADFTNADLWSTTAEALRGKAPALRIDESMKPGSTDPVKLRSAPRADLLVTVHLIRGDGGALTATYSMTLSRACLVAATTPHDTAIQPLDDDDMAETTPWERQGIVSGANAEQLRARLLTRIRALAAELAAGITEAGPLR